MVRNNEDRIGIDDRNTGAEIPMQTQSSPLSFVSPTEFVELPSRGKFYPPDHPLHKVDTIEIKHMTTKEEDILTSQALLKKGKALDRFISAIIVDKRINPDSLIVGDKNAILIEARKSGYGAVYETQVICPICQINSLYSFDLDSATVSKDVDEYISGNDNVTATDNGTFTIKQLPVTGWTVEVKPLDGRDEKVLASAIETRQKNNLPEDALITQMSTYVVAIQGITDKAQIKKAISEMPAKDARELRTTYQKIMPNVDISQTFNCSECGYSGIMEVPFTTDFFWPKQ